MHDFYGYYGYGIMDVIGHALGWVIIVLFIIWILKLIKRSGNSRMLWSNDPAMDLLRERYVKGEITKEEFESKKKDLASN